MLCQNHVKNVPKVNSWWSHLLPVILLVYSVLLFHILLILLFPNWIKPPRVPRLWMLPRHWAGAVSSENRKWKYTNLINIIIIRFQVCGVVWYPELSWLVPWPPPNGSSMMPSKYTCVCPDHHHQKCQNLWKRSWASHSKNITTTKSQFLSLNFS